MIRVAMVILVLLAVGISIWAAKTAEPKKKFDDPAFQEWVRDVAQLPADQQMKAVETKLRELNPDFRGELASTIENGVVTRLSFESNGVTDLAPVRALTGLKFLNCSGSYTTVSMLTDLAPLHGMRLTSLMCGMSQVSDLTPLKGMPLTRLDCYTTNVSDLSPLEGMPLTILHCGKTQVSDLSPLQGMKLIDLYFSHTRVTDLSPLRQMPLKTVLCADTPVSDLSPLAECKSLRGLIIKDCPQITSAQIGALQNALPDCKIE